MTREECQALIIPGTVCEGCGGDLEPINTVDNGGTPTHWIGCRHCMSFRCGIERRYFEVARKLVEADEITPYSHMHRYEYENDPERLSYFLDSQTAGLSNQIKRIDLLLHPPEKDEVKP